MSACETCWTEASRKALVFGGHTADRYRDELAAHPEHGDHGEHGSHHGEPVTTTNAHENVGRLVTYQDPNWPPHRVEEGTITSANDSYVFVRFGTAGHGVACDPERLRYSIAAPAPGV